MKAILIVEDDITFGMMLKTWLGKKGFEVSSVSNIARARKHIESQTVDLVLSDLRLPDYEGIDLLKWMNDRGLDIPLIIMTGYADIQSAVLAMKLGARDYIAKPVNPEELLKKIMELENKFNFDKLSKLESLSYKGVTRRINMVIRFIDDISCNANIDLLLDKFVIELGDSIE